MSSPEKTDLRVIKTKKAIRNAFAELLSEKDIQKITIKDIADTAVINRKTFYNYPKDLMAAYFLPHFVLNRLRLYCTFL